MDGGSAEPDEPKNIDLHQVMTCRSILAKGKDQSSMSFWKY